MNQKRIIMFFMLLGTTIGGLLPLLFGDTNLLDGWSIAGALIGGIVGIYGGVKIAKQFG